MKYLSLKNTAVFLAILLLTTNNIAHIFLSNKRPKKLMVKVLLNKINSHKKSLFNISSKDSFILKLKSGITSKRFIIKENNLNLIVQNGTITVEIKQSSTNKVIIKKIKNNQLEISSKTGAIELNNTLYSGNLIFQIDLNDNNNLLVMNKLSLNKYVYSVLASEIYPSWPIEMQKVQAVISRTYAVHQIDQNNKRKKKYLYHIKNTNFHQTYNGHHEHKHLEEAIKKTDSELIIHNGKPALAMFDACCGGIEPYKIDSLDFKKAPYLARKNACNFCKNYGRHSWKKAFFLNNVLKKLKSNPNLAKKFTQQTDKLIDIKVINKDKAGIVKKLKLFFEKKRIVLSGNQFWDALKGNVYSLNFTLKKINNKIIIEGHGFGHQIGLCQRGANELVKRGWNYKRVIEFYYPGIKFAKLQHAKI